MAPDTQGEAHGGRGQVRESRADLVEETGVEVGPVEVAVRVAVFGVRPGGGRQRGDAGTRTVGGVRGGAALGGGR